jgi:hypothetical protein
VALVVRDMCAAVGRSTAIYRAARRGMALGRTGMALGRTGTALGRTGMALGRTGTRGLLPVVFGWLVISCVIIARYAQYLTARGPLRPVLTGTPST